MKLLYLRARKVTAMSNALKATKLDFSLVKPYIKVIGFTMLLPIAFAAINRSLLTGVSFAMCFIAMTTGYTFSITEKNSMERLYGILPVKKSEMVTGRYLFVLALGALALMVSLIAQPIVLRAMGETVSSSQDACGQSHYDCNCKFIGITYCIGDCTYRCYVCCVDLALYSAHGIQRNMR